MSRSRELVEIATAYDSGGAFGMRNRVINGDMRIDQRNNGSTVSADLAFPVDRFKIYRNGGAATCTAQRSTTAPTGFSYSLVYTVGTGAAPGAGDYSGIAHPVEGLNCADLNWGTANAKTLTLSFWVRASVTGTYGVGVKNAANNRSRIFSYTIDQANTWEFKSIEIPGDTSGTWAVDTTLGMNLTWDLGVGTTFSAAAGSWQAGNYYGLTSGTKLATTAGATFYLSGVQLEVGIAATAFQYRPIGLETAMCQRYFEKGNVPVLYLPASGGGYWTVLMVPIWFKATKRNTSYTMSYASLQVYVSGTPTSYGGASSTVNTAVEQCSLYLSTTVTNNGGTAAGTWTCESEL